ncbi:hypothetical protein QFC19_002830 [Naganishia cerealis]|uniref:Uncharacterized protein n=1 Tax=Naganishia cerealis TaxID=610337 RepID=A0ACC2W610_9TREE|nr:hypothetical protein QFC19_002830 [Naganishia cerealis]
MSDDVLACDLDVVVVAGENGDPESVVYALLVPLESVFADVFKLAGNAEVRSAAARNLD